MVIDLSVLELHKHPELVSFLSATSLDDISTAMHRLSRSSLFPNYPYGHRPAFIKTTISVYEICAALGKLEHLKCLLDARHTSTHRFSDGYARKML